MPGSNSTKTDNGKEENGLDTETSLREETLSSKQVKMQFHSCTKYKGHVYNQIG